MPEKSDNTALNDQLLNLYREEAKWKYQDHTIDELLCDQKKLTTKSFFKWLSEKIGALFNLAKVAVMSVFLGRRETAKRLEAGEKEKQLESIKSDAQKAIKSEIIEELLSKSKAEAAINQEQPEEVDKNGSKSLEADPSTEMEKDSEKKYTKTIFAQQLDQLTDKYCDGLKTFISMQTGINKDFIQIENTSDSKFQISFTNATDTSQYYKGMTIDEYGCTAEKTDVAKALAALVLYYTAHIYRDSKNQTQFPGTIPSKNMIRNKFEIGKTTLKGGAKQYATNLFGHELQLSVIKDKLQISLDGRSIPITKEEEIVERIQKEFRNKILGSIAIRRFSIPLEHSDGYLHFNEKCYIKGDYANISSLSTMLHLITRSELHESFWAKYSTTDLQKHFCKELDNFIKDNSGITRGIDFHGHHIHLELSKDKEISGVAVDAEVVYGTIGGISHEKETGVLSNEDITSLIVHNLEEGLEKEGLYWNIETTKQDPSPISELDENGKLLVDDSAFTYTDDQYDPNWESEHELEELSETEELEY